LHQTPTKAFTSKATAKYHILDSPPKEAFKLYHQIQTQSLQNEGASIIFGKTEEKAAKAKEEE